VGIQKAAETLLAAIGSGDWDAAAALMDDDFVQEWPQSGERIVGREDALAVMRNFPGGPPTTTPRRTVARKDVVVTEVELRYGDGSVFHGVSILEFRDGRVVRETDYFAEPFVPPQWRAQWVRRI
jgi:ketosteroid isomerase-like protein